jgi:hypothetical protein
MAYVSSNYLSNQAAPVGKWTCAPGSRLGPLTSVPTETQSRSPDLCGQCVSYVKKVCPSLPQTSMWKKGVQVKNATNVLAGTVIATFNANGRYEGHAAIYVRQGPTGITVCDQYRTPPSPKAVGERLLRWGAHGNSNNGDNFYVVD